MSPQIPTWSQNDPQDPPTLSIWCQLGLPNPPKNIEKLMKIINFSMFFASLTKCNCRANQTHNLEPRWFNLEPRPPKLEQKWSQDPPTWSQDGSQTLHLGAKIAPKTPHLRAKMAPRPPTSSCNGKFLQSYLFTGNTIATQ